MDRRGTPHLIQDRRDRRTRSGEEVESGGGVRGRKRGKKRERVGWKKRGGRMRRRKKKEWEKK
jgi:hypothetical protein